MTRGRGLETARIAALALCYVACSGQSTSDGGEGGTSGSATGGVSGSSTGGGGASAKLGLYLLIRNPDPPIAGRTCPASSGIEWDIGAPVEQNGTGVALDVVGGASIGAIIGAGFAADWSISEMTEVYRSSFVAENPLSDWTVPFVSLVAGRAVSRLLKDAYGQRDIEDLVRPFFCVSTSLTHGRTLVHRRGPVWKWLRASAAIPGVLPPVFSQGHVLVDGGVMNNLPVDVMREAHVSEVIAVDIGADDAVTVPGELDEFELPPLWKVMWDWVQGFKRPSLPRLMLGSGMVNAGAATTAARAASSLVLTPPVGDIDLLNWDAFDLAIERGYESTLRALEKAPVR